MCLRFVADAELDIDQLKQWSREHLSPHQVPAVIEQAETIPRLPNGKVSRRLLSEAPANTLAAEVPA